MFDDNLDPELADLLGDIEEDIGTSFSGDTTPATIETDIPLTQVSQNSAAQAPSAQIIQKVELSPDQEFLKKIIEGEKNEYANRLVDQLDKAMNSRIKEDKTIFRQKLIPTYWGFVTEMAPRMTASSPIEKIYCLRYGIVDINLLNAEQREMIKSISMTFTSDYPFYYVDEWLKNVSQGQIKASLVDEVAAKKGDTSGAQERLDRKIDSKGAELGILKNRSSERSLIEKSLMGLVKILIEHSSLTQFENIPDAYTPEQKNIIVKIMDDLRKLKNIDAGMAVSIRELNNIDSEIRELQTRIGDGSGNIELDSGIITNEFNSLRQMVKMCVGPRGNHFPILIGDYCPVNINQINTKENVVKLMEEIEKRDGQVFNREFKGQINKIIPYIILVPAFGEKGICWEPFDMRQRATSRGRIALPLYPREPLISLLNALGDLRWQVAKEKAAYRWMEEGITGKYYNYFTDNKVRGNIKDEFVKDYILWITQEWNGMQKLHKDVRTIFWRHIPFPQSKKEELKNRGFFYSDLFKKDTNRSMSDGY